MSKALVSYLTQRPDAATFLLPGDIPRSLQELFPKTEQLLPQPYKIFPSDETQGPSLGFPVADVTLMKDLELRLDRWLAEEVVWQVKREPNAKEKTQIAFNLYLTQLMRVAENALMSNLLNDYHAVFWLAHSLDLARHFSALPRRISAVDMQAGRAQGETLKYRIFGRWVSETREQMTQLAAKAAQLLDGEEQRGLQFFRLLQDDVLIFTEEFVGPDLRELRSFVQGYLRRDFQTFRDVFERMRTTATDLLQKDRTFRASIGLFGVNPDQGITLALLLDARFQAFLFDNTGMQNSVTREDREQFQLIARRVREFAVINQLRRGIVWMSETPDGQVVAADRRGGNAYSRSTRPMDFGRPGVVDPMVHRFGLIYDISAFSETLGTIRRGGGKEEIKSYRHMLLFQRKLEGIAQRHQLVFEKFLGDGAFYTTRRAMKLVRASIEIQRFYSEMKRKGFAFNKGLRIATNYGYYRLLPMKVSPDSNERITEFYGPGIVELSRLTTGKANKEIEEIASFLVAHGYDSFKVTQFFAPLARGVDVIDHTQHAREFYAYLNSSGHLINEGIVASIAFLQELSNELMQETQQLLRVRSPWGSYIGFVPSVPGVEAVGVRILGVVKLKGLEDIEVGELVPFAAGDAEITPLDPGDSLVTLLRAERHSGAFPSIGAIDVDDTKTTESEIVTELVICVSEDEVLIGEWNPQSDDVLRPLRLPRADFLRLFSIKAELTADLLNVKKDVVREMYERLCDRDPAPAMALSPLRDEFETFVLGEIVEKL